MNKIVPFSYLLLLMSICYSCKSDTKKANSVTKAPIEFRKEALLTFTKVNGDTIKTIDIEIADNEYQRQTGLMYRKSMKEQQGMLFLFDDQSKRNFYMKNTHIPLDIIYIDSNKKVVSIQKKTKPLSETSLPSEGPAQYVLEINAGLSDQWGIDSETLVNWITP